MAAQTVIVEVMIRGTQLGGWRGLPATGRRVEFPLCGVYTFDANDRLAGEKIYYDRGTVLRQLGVLRAAEPSRAGLHSSDPSNHDCARLCEKARPQVRLPISAAAAIS